MKKNLIKLGVMLAATFALTNCTEEITNVPTPEVAKNPYTIYANAPETKTVNDGFATKWAEKDSLNVAHAPAGTMDLSWNTRFDLADAASGRFETDNLQGELVVSNDWYVLYPYSEYVEYLSDTQASNAWFPVGSKASGVQTQKGNNSMAHIAGPDYPMYGIVKDSYSEEFPSLMMSHLSSLVEVKVTNNAGEPASVNSIIFTAPEDVVGTYFIDITSEVPTFTPSGENYVSNIAILTVKDGEPIAAGESASFYFAIKPFTAPAGSELTIDVNGTKKSINVEYDVTFSSGKIKTINFDYDEIIEPKESIQEGTYWITAELDGAERYANAHAEGTNYGYLKADSEGFIDNAFTFTAVRGGGFTIQQADGRYLYLTGSYNSFNVSKELPAEGAVWNAYVNDDGTHSIVNVDKLKTIYYSSEYKNYAAYPWQNDGDILPVLVNAEDAEERPVFTLSTTSINVEASDTSVEFSIKSNLDWTISSEADVDINPESGNGDATVTVSFAANETDSPIKYVIVISTEEFGDRKVTITHAPAADLNLFSWLLGNKAYDKTSGQKGTVNGEALDDFLKLGTSSLKGDATLNIPAGTKKLGFYCVAWKGKKANVQFSIDGEVIAEIAPKANDGATGNPPYTITVTDDDYYEIEIPTAEAVKVKVETMSNSAGRAIFFGFKIN